MPKKIGPPPSIELLREFLDYSPSDGLFMWRKQANRNGSAPVGSVAGCIDGGYVKIRLKGKFYKAHRLAWLYVHGEWPSVEIDHINVTPTDNRIVNLRLATYAQQAANRKLRSDNKSGFKGVSWNKSRSKWLACVYSNGLRTDLGYFDDPSAAHAAYVSAAKTLFGAFAHDGRSNLMEAA